MNKPQPQFGTFRAEHIDGGEYVYGASVVHNGEYFIVTYISEGNKLTNVWNRIDPTTLSAYTTKSDSNGKPIFGNFEVDGVMTDRGDEVNGINEFDCSNIADNGKVVWKYLSWRFLTDGHYYPLTDYMNLTIIPRERK